jgi:GTP diphosphokinase / guanosine-3',5'-bis(diphosphate) 3'-diphosphatase
MIEGIGADIQEDIAELPFPPVVDRAPARGRVLRQYELVDRIRAYDPDVNEDQINRAYIFAMQRHGSQMRASGDPYFAHPIEVAGILTELRLDSASIITGLLHDTVEDTTATLEEIASLFGDEVTSLVDGVTKLSQLELASNRTKQAENLQKFILALSKDVRVLLVKLADRLHNMRTLHFIKKPEKRQRIARETADIYAPLARRMGVQRFSGELEDLSFQHLHPEAYKTIHEQLANLRSARAQAVAAVTGKISTALQRAGIEARVVGREKRAYSVWKKLERKSISFSDVSDLYGFRVIVADVPQCYRALGVIHDAWSCVPGRFKDYISVPKPNGYKSIHTAVVGPSSTAVDIQIPV